MIRGPRFLSLFRHTPAPVTPAVALARQGAEKRKAEQRAKSRAFHREMRAQLGLPAVPEWEDA